MRKRTLHPDERQTAKTAPGSWLNIEKIATVEVTSEEATSPVEGVFSLDQPRPWRAIATGPQTIKLIFDEPQTLHRIQLAFSETDRERTQEFSVAYSTGGSSGPRELVRQQWTFSPQGSTREQEDYQVEIHDVMLLQLTIDPDRGRHDSVATLDRWLIG